MPQGPENKVDLRPTLELTPGADGPAPWLDRRRFLKSAGAGFGSLGLLDLLMRQGVVRADGGDVPQAGAGMMKPRSPHHAPRAKAVIFLFMYGGPSGFDLFDPKPVLQKSDGKTADFSINTFFDGKQQGKLMASPYKFKPHGQCGQQVSEVFPELAKCVDEIAFLKSCHVDSNNHGPAMIQMNTGVIRVGLPSMGSWITYGLGSENNDMPGHITMYDWRGGPINGAQNWSSGFLPSNFQGTAFRSSGTPILDLQRQPGISAQQQMRQIKLIEQLGRGYRQANPAEADLQARIESFELAYRMNAAAPGVVDLSGESEETKALYGMDKPVSRYFGTQCLLARRMVERGIRFIQIYSGGGNQQESWDAHLGLKVNHDMHCAETDRPMYGLITDLKRRGLLDSTLIVWGGEFGRLPIIQNYSGKTGGRDHNPQGFLMWMAGGGIKGGVSHGQTDEVGWKATVDPTSVNDVHATILHQLGIDHERLTYLHDGRAYRLTDLAGEVIEPILA